MPKNQTAKILSGAVYYNDDRNTPKDLVVDHSFDAYTENKGTGFYSKVYYNKNNDTVIITFRGSNGPKDWFFSDSQMVKSEIPAQFYDADKLYNAVLQKYPNSNISFAGHSLGGSLAQLMSKHTGKPSTTFEPYGTGKIIKNNSNLFSKDADIINYGRNGDWIFGANSAYQPGTTYILPALEQRTNLSFLRGPFRNLYRSLESARMIKSGFLESHKLENYPLLGQAHPLNSVQKNRVASSGIHKSRNLRYGARVRAAKAAASRGVIMHGTSNSPGVAKTLINPAPAPITRLNPAFEAGGSTGNEIVLVNNYLSGTSSPDLTDAAVAIVNSNKKTSPSSSSSSSSNSGGGFNWWGIVSGLLNFGGWGGSAPSTGGSSSGTDSSGSSEDAYVSGYWYDY